jgi:hypothetical protein
MASSRDGAGHLSSTSLVLREGTSTASGDGRDRRRPRTPQAIKEQITRNSAILTEPGWESVTSLYWVYNVAKRYVKMHHIDKLFPQAVWNYNHKASGVKPSESTSKHFAHRALEVWSALYPDKPFGSKNKNIISYSMVAMLYAELELRRKVDWQSLLTRNKETERSMRKEMCLTTSILPKKMLGLDLHLMHMEPIETLQDLQKQYRTKILWEKQFALQKADPGLRTKRVPVHQGSWTLACQGWKGIFKMQGVLVGPI